METFCVTLDLLQGELNVRELSDLPVRDDKRRCTGTLSPGHHADGRAWSP